MRIMQKKMSYYLFIFRRFWVKEPRHSENIFAKKRYTSIVAHVGSATYPVNNPMAYTYAYNNTEVALFWPFFFLHTTCAAGVVTKTTDRDSLRYTYHGTRRVRQLALGCESN